MSNLSSAAARFIWIDPEGAGRNRYVLFRRSLALASPAKSAELHLFADTRYRLVVNGQVLGHGPARFFPARPEYDSYDLTPYLRAGTNVIAVTVNSYGCSSFHSDASRGALVAWGRVVDQAGDELPLATDESWRALESPGHHRDVPQLSFALNPGEYLDARPMPAGWDLRDFDDSAWPHAVVQAHRQQWGEELRPRSIPMLDERRGSPRRMLGAWVARDLPDEQVYSFSLSVTGAPSHGARGRVAVMTFLHSPRQQTVTFGAWWGKYWINGEALKPARRSDVDFRQDFTATLRQGWNTLLVYESTYTDIWEFYLSLPRQAGLSISAEKQTDSPHTFLIGGPWLNEQVDAAERVAWPIADAEALPPTLGPWRRWAREDRADLPHRERAAKVLERIGSEQSVEGVDVAALADKTGDGSLLLLYDFGTEVLGRPVIDLTAPAGTTIDLCYTERLKPDGSAQIFSHHFVNTVERYITREARQQFQTFHPRGMRYLEVVVGGADLSRVRLHDVGVTRANYPVQPVGSFQCSDPTLSEIWAMGQRTLHACMEDAYLDCPWRERGLYSGDFLVEYFVNLAAFGDQKLFRRCIELFLTRSPGSHQAHTGLADYGAIIVHSAYQYWAHSGDVQALRGFEPELKRLIDGLHATLQSHGGRLVDATGLHPYIDLCYMDKAGVNCALNCFYQYAFQCASSLLRLLGDEALAMRYAAVAQTMAEAIGASFWDDTRGLFTDRRAGDVPDPQPSVPANALPIVYGIATKQQAARAVEWLAEAMDHNFRVPQPQDNADCNVTSYFAFYALGALYQCGKVAEAERFMKTYWGLMLDAGAWTCWEYFVDNASRCHAWSAAPTHRLSTQVLGVSFPEPGNPDRVHLAPRPGTLSWASGVYPLAKGPLRVEWQLQNGRPRLLYDAPAGVTVTMSDATDLCP